MSDNSELKYAVEFLRDDAKRHNPHDFADSIQWAAADALEAMAGEVDSLKQAVEAEKNEQARMEFHHMHALADLAAERDRLKAALDGTGGFFVERTPELDAMFDDPAAATDVRQSMQRWIDHHNERADKAEAEVERLTAALNEIAGFADDRPGDWAAMHARKALGDAS